MTPTDGDASQRWLSDVRSALGREQWRVAEAVRDLGPAGWGAHLGAAAAARLTSLGHFQDYGSELTWTPREVVGHLRDSARIFARRIRLLQADGAPVLEDFVTDDPRRIRDYATGPTDRLLTELELAQQDLRLTLASVTTAQLPYRGRHEVDGELTLTDVVGFLPGHQRDHAEQLVELVSSGDGRPSA